MYRTGFCAMMKVFILTMIDSASVQEFPMRKTILLAIIACILGIVILAALAFCIPNRFGSLKDDRESEVFTGFHFSTEKPAKPGPAVPDEASSSSFESLPNDTLPGGSKPAVSQPQTVTETDALSDDQILRSGQKPALVKTHQIIWVGDSRTLGMGNALHKAGRYDDEDVFAGAVGEGVRWFREQGMGEMSDAIAKNPLLPVVLNFGVNDPQLIDEYIVAYQDVIDAHPDTAFYILSVNPIDEEFLIEDGQVHETVFDDINSLNIARMNVRLKKEFGSRYIDSASFLKTDGFETVDGLHFSTQTYLKIHDFVVNQLF